MNIPVLCRDDSPAAAFFEFEFDTSIGFAIENESAHFISFDPYHRARRFFIQVFPLFKP